MKIIFCTEGWWGCIPGSSPTNTIHSLFNSLEYTGIAEFERLHYDEYASTHDGNRIDGYLLERCEQYQPDAVCFSYYHLAHWGMMLEETLQKIKDMGIKTIFVWWDQFNKVGISPHLVDLSIDFNRDNYGLWMPEDPRLFCDPGKERDIDVSFLGSLYLERNHFCGVVSARLAPKINLYIGGGQRSQNLSMQQYVDVYQRSKIVMNFCTTGQIKGRVYEAMMCGALLLEQDNPHIHQFFEPMVHYVPFGPPDDLVDKIEYYLAHEEERLAIAAAGKAKCATDYSAEKWWSRVFELIGVK